MRQHTCSTDCRRRTMERDDRGMHSSSRGTGKAAWIFRAGGNRQLSVLNGLEDIRGYAADEDYVFIHDAARPVLSGCQIMECLEAAAGHDGVVPVLPMKDTVYASADMHKISSLLDRGSIFAGQAPEVFQIGKYYKAV